MIVRLSLLAIIVTALTAAPAAAQGRGKGLGKKGGQAPVATAPVLLDAETGVPISGTGLRQFGSWLDDASLLDEGSAWTAFSFAHMRSTGGSQTDFPVADFSYGLTPRAQFGMSVPYYRVDFSDGTTARGIGDVYLTAKFAVIPPDSKRNWGVSVSPIIEVLDDPSPESSRFGLGLPVNAEIRFNRARVYGSAGIFTRGALFASGAVEVPVNERVIVTGALTAMRAVNNDDIADALTLPKSRSDVNVVGAYFLTPTIAVFGGTGRTLSNAATIGSTFLITAGLSFSM